MTTGTRIPRSIEDFSRFLSVTTTYLVTGSPETNGIRLGLSQKEIDRWCAFTTVWTPLYGKFCDKKNGRTSGVIEQLHMTVQDAVDFDKEINMLDRIASSVNATITDHETFNIKSGLLQKTTRSVSLTPVSESVQPILQPIGGGQIGIKCYSTTSPRASIFGDADSVQYLYVIGTTPPASVVDPSLTKEISSRAAFTLAVGAENKAKYLYIFFRWYNTRHPELAGPWSDMEMVLIQ